MWVKGWPECFFFDVKEPRTRYGKWAKETIEGVHTQTVHTATRLNTIMLPDSLHILSMTLTCSFCSSLITYITSTIILCVHCLLFQMRFCFGLSIVENYCKVAWAHLCFHSQYTYTATVTTLQMSTLDTQWIFMFPLYSIISFPQVQCGTFVWISLFTVHTYVFKCAFSASAVLSSSDHDSNCITCDSMSSSSEYYTRGYYTSSHQIQTTLAQYPRKRGCWWV